MSTSALSTQDLSSIVQAIDLCVSPYTNEDQRRKATLYLEQIKNRDERVQIGLQLLHEYESKQQQVSSNYLLFAMQLFRVHLSNIHRNRSSCSNYSSNIRQSLMQCAQRSLNHFEPMIANSLANILTMCVKCDYPNIWPTAFEEIFQLASIGLAGINIIVRILSELDSEVVIYDDKRTSEEIAQNTVIKDAIRAKYNENNPSIAEQIVQFLCEYSAKLRITNPNIQNSPEQQVHSNLNLSIKCLETLVDYIGWVDINLILNNSILGYLYSILNDVYLNSVACKCLLEVVKKGMEIDLKIELLKNMQLIPILLQVPLELTTTNNRNNENQNNYEEFGLLVDMIFLTLIGYWQKAEEMTIFARFSHDIPSTPADVNPTEINILMTTATMMTSLCPLLLHLFQNANSIVACTVMPSLNRLASLLKQQLKNQARIEQFLQKGVFVDYFVADRYTNKLLMAIFKQMQYSPDFEFDIEDDNDIEEIERKKEVRKLFVNCCRVKPQSCLELVLAALANCQQPLSTAEFPTLEASLRLLYAFAECGPINDPIVHGEGVSRIILALHQSDICTHAHPQVLLAYYDVAVRYVKQANEESLYKVVSNLAGVSGLRHPLKMIRNRSATLLLKLIEAIEVQTSGSIFALIPLVLSFEDLLLQRETSLKLSPEAQLRFLEAVGLIAASEPKSSTSTTYSPAVIDSYIQSQLAISSGLLASISGQIQQIVAEINRKTGGNSSRILQGDEFVEMVTDQIRRCSSFSKGFSRRSRREFIPMFTQLCEVVVMFGLQSLASVDVIRLEVIVLIHRMLALLGTDSIPIFQLVLPILVQYTTSADIEQLITLANQFMGEFNSTAISTMDPLIFPILDKLLLSPGSLYSSTNINSSPTNLNLSSLLPSHAEAECFGMMKLYIAFVLHIFNTGCKNVLFSQIHNNHQRVSEIYNNLFSWIIYSNSTIITNKESKIFIMRSALSAIIEICTQWKDENIYPLMNELNTIFIIEKLLPHILQKCVDGSLNIKDAQTLTIYSDIAGLIWTIAYAKGAETLALYLQSNANANASSDSSNSLLKTLGWNDLRSNALVQLLAMKLPINPFKEEFRKLLK